MIINLTDIMSQFLNKVHFSLIWETHRIRMINIWGRILKVRKKKSHKILILVKPLKVTFLMGNKSKWLIRFWTSQAKFLDLPLRRRKSHWTVHRLNKMSKIRKKSKVTTMCSSQTIHWKRPKIPKTAVHSAGWMRARKEADWNGDYTLESFDQFTISQNVE